MQCMKSNWFVAVVTPSTTNCVCLVKSVCQLFTVKLEMLLKLPDCQIMPASSEQSYMLFHLPLLPFAVVNRSILLFFSDSMSSLEAINGFKLKIDILQNIIKDYTHLANSGKTIILCWIPMQSCQYSWQ